MARAARPCRIVGCRHLVRDDRPCPVHPRRPFQGAHSPGRKVSASMRAQVLREERCCGICHQPGLSDDEVDHIKPVADGGGNERENLRRAHAECNRARGAALGRARQKAAAAAARAS